MIRILSSISLLLVALLGSTAAWAGLKAPEFPPGPAERWLNSPPLSLEALRGKPVLLEFWTFGCMSCRRSIPWVQSLEKSQAGKLQIIGIHTPEFPHEASREAVAAKLKAFEIRHPTYLDNDFQYWNAMGNRYWPAFYLLDGEGRIQGAWAGEVSEGSPRALEIEKRILQLHGDMADPGLLD